MPTFEYLFSGPDNEPEDIEYLPEPKIKDIDGPVCILHSSGMSRYLALRVDFTNVVVILRLGRVPKTGHHFESQLGYFLPFAMVRRP